MEPIPAQLERFQQGECANNVDTLGERVAIQREAEPCCVLKDVGKDRQVFLERRESLRLESHEIAKSVVDV